MGVTGGEALREHCEVPAHDGLPDDGAAHIGHGAQAVRHQRLADVHAVGDLLAADVLVALRFGQGQGCCEQFVGALGAGFLGGLLVLFSTL